MQHFYGIDISPSFDFEERIKAIAKAISQKKNSRVYFGNRPFVSPDNKVFLLKKDDENEILLMNNNNGPEPSINLTVRHYIMSEDDFKKITMLTKEICEIVCKELGVQINKIGSVYQKVHNVQNRYEVFQKEFSASLFPNLTQDGGFIRHIYEDFPVEINKVMLIHLDVDVSRSEEKILVKVDINNKDNYTEMVPEEVVKIGEYSYSFLNDKLSVVMKEKGINLNG